MHKGRYTVQNEKDVVVLIIGMKIHKLFHFHQWIPIMKSMGTMLKELYSNSSHGFLHGEVCLNWKGVTVIQYWESFEKLEAYAHNETHRQFWRYYNQKAAQKNVVGIFHETYIVPAKNYEAIYVNMPKFGLGKALPFEEVDKHTNSSRERLDIK